MGHQYIIRSSRRSCLKVVGQTKCHLEHQLVVEKEEEQRVVVFFQVSLDRRWMGFNVKIQ